jgi:hypothetical protein
MFNQMSININQSIMDPNQQHIIERGPQDLNSSNAFDYQTIRKTQSQIEDDINDKSSLNLMDHSYYYLLIGKLDNKHLQLYSINDPNCESFFASYTWPIDVKYVNLFSDRLLDIYFITRSNLVDFQNSLINLQDTESMIFLQENPNLIEILKSKGVTEEDSKMMILAIRNYTGSTSWVNNRICAHDIKSSFLSNSTSHSINNDVTLINSYFLKALHCLPIHFGTCTRCLYLSDEELGSYLAGSIVTWFQFSSSTIGEVPHPDFLNRNAIFVIYSVSGRKISTFSKYKSEQEVVFLPFSQFLVLKFEYREDKPYIFLRQVEMGISEKNVLWVDENIFYPESTVKDFLEYSSVVTPRTRFILKTTCESALAFLSSAWGERKKENLQKFRIIISSYFLSNDEACYVFCSYALRLGFNCKIMIYSSNMAETWRWLNHYQLVNFGIQVVSDAREIGKFICFSS